VQGLL